MKKIIVLLLFLASFAFLANSQPSKTTVLAKVKSLHSKNLVSAKLIGSGISERVYENGSWRYYYRHSYKVVNKTQYPGVNRVYSGGIQYKKGGGYYQQLVGDAYYTGISNPKESEIIKMMKADLKNFVRLTNYNQIVGEITDIKLADDPKWNWRKVTMVEFKMQATFSIPISYTKIEKAVHIFNVSLVADQFKGPWVRFLSTEAGRGERKVLSTTTHTADEVRAMKTLYDIDQENQAKAIMGNLPNVGEIPKFESDKQLFYFVHDKILTKSTNEVKAYLYKIMNKSYCFTGKSSVVMTSRTQGWFDKLINNHDAYKTAHCQYPTVKHEQAGQIEFYDKENRRILRFTGSKSGDTWTLNLISFYPAKASDLTRMKNNNANCKGKPNLTVRKIIAYNIGDKINAKFSNGTFPAFIEKKDPSFSNRYYIKLERDPKGRGYWMTEDNFSTYTGGANNNSNANNNNSNNQVKKVQTFAVGDKVEVKVKAGWIKGKIIRKASNKFLVKFNDKRYGDTWCAAKYMKK